MSIIMKHRFVVLGIGNSGEKYPMAISSSQSSAIGYANMCKCNTHVKSCSDVEVLDYMGKFYVLNLD